MTKTSVQSIETYMQKVLFQDKEPKKRIIDGESRGAQDILDIYNIHSCYGEPSKTLGSKHCGCTPLKPVNCYKLLNDKQWICQFQAEHLKNSGVDHSMKEVLGHMELSCLTTVNTTTHETDLTGHQLAASNHLLRLFTMHFMANIFEQANLVNGRKISMHVKTSIS